MKKEATKPEAKAARKQVLKLLKEHVEDDANEIYFGCFATYDEKTTLRELVLIAAQEPDVEGDVGHLLKLAIKESEAYLDYVRGKRPGDKMHLEYYRGLINGFKIVCEALVEGKTDSLEALGHTNFRKLRVT